MKAQGGRNARTLPAGDVLLLAVGFLFVMTSIAGWRQAVEFATGCYPAFLVWLSVCYAVFQTLEGFAASRAGGQVAFQTALAGVLFSFLASSILAAGFSAWRTYGVALVLATPVQLGLVACWRHLRLHEHTKRAAPDSRRWCAPRPAPGHLKKLTKLQSALKRSLDLTTVAVTLPITVPLGLLISFATILSRTGPVFYRQDRVGLEGKTFSLWKFRTMIVNAESYTGPVLSCDRDPRITPLGKVLRITRLDELPQLINVLVGDMSIVGPRPERPCFVGTYLDRIPGYEKRTLVKPGLTGLAQVMGTYATEAREKLAYDLLYIGEYSLWMDIEILLVTPVVMMTPGSARGVAKDPAYYGPPSSHSVPYMTTDAIPKE